MRMDCRRGGSTISDGVWGTIEEEGASKVLESKVSVPAWEGVSEVLGTWDDKLSESLEKGSIWIRPDLIKLWVADGIE